MLVSLSGKARSGKDTLADYLIANKGFTKVSFAGPLKELTSQAFNIPLKELYDDKKDDQYSESKFIHTHKLELFLDGLNEIYPFNPHIKEKIVFTWAGKPYKSHRQLMQILGDVGRTGINENIWVDCLVSNVDTNQNIVCCDARFPNERTALKEIGAKLVLINRAGETIIDDSHASENSFEGLYDLIIDNNSSKEELLSKADSVLTSNF